MKREELKDGTLELSRGDFEYFISSSMRTRTKLDIIMEAFLEESDVFAESFVDGLLLDYIVLIAKILKLDKDMEGEFIDWCLTDDFDREENRISFLDYRKRANDRLSIDDVYNILAGGKHGE